MAAMSRVESRADSIHDVMNPLRPAGWWRVAVTTVGTLLVLILAYFYVPHWLLTQLDAVPRSARVWLATAWMGLVFALSCIAALRFTQSAARTG